jgi:hypothetical protein
MARRSRVGVIGASTSWSVRAATVPPVTAGDPCDIAYTPYAVSNGCIPMNNIEYFLSSQYFLNIILFQKGTEMVHEFLPKAPMALANASLLPLP